MFRTTDASNGKASIERVVRFELTVPLTYNPPAPGLFRPEIPARLIAGMQCSLRGRFGGNRSWVGEGDFVDPNTGYILEGEPDQYFRINVRWDKAAEAWEWFVEHCPQWASLFGQ